MSNAVTIFLLIVAGFVIWMTVPHAKYRAFYYPNAEYLHDPEISQDEFNSVEACREWVDLASGGRADEGYTYECGKNCKLSEDYMYLLENEPETIKEMKLEPEYICEEVVD